MEARSGENSRKQTKVQNGSTFVSKKKTSDKPSGGQQQKPSDKKVTSKPEENKGKGQQPKKRYNDIDFGEVENKPLSWDFLSQKANEQ